MLLNDIDISTAHMDRLVKEISSSNSVDQNYLQQEVPDIRTHVESLLSLTPKFNSILKVRWSSVTMYVMLCAHSTLEWH